MSRWLAYRPRLSAMACSSRNHSPRSKVLTPAYDIAQRSPEAHSIDYLIPKKRLPKSLPSCQSLAVISRLPFFRCNAPPSVRALETDNNENLSHARLKARLLLPRQLTQYDAGTSRLGWCAVSSVRSPVEIVEFTELNSPWVKTNTPPTIALNRSMAFTNQDLNRRGIRIGAVLACSPTR
jgi:hypothetical protein